jgi:hypothetical protein
MKIGNSGSGDSHPDDLDGIPWRVANALAANGWSLRDHIILEKSNPMPESDTGLVIENEECVFTLAKGETYFYDAEAIKEPIPGSLVGYQYKGDIWTIPWEASREAHFAIVPAKVVESCILAGTSDMGCCAHCGAPWERVMYDTGRTQTMTIGCGQLGARLYSPPISARASLASRHANQDTWLEAHMRVWLARCALYRPRPIQRHGNHRSRRAGPEPPLHRLRNVSGSHKSDTWTICSTKMAPSNGSATHAHIASKNGQQKVIRLDDKQAYRTDAGAPPPSTCPTCRLIVLCRQATKKLQTSD